MKLGLPVILLAITIFWSVEQTHLPASTGITGLNAYNILLAITFIAIYVNGIKAAPSPPMKWPILFFFFALTWGFLIGQFSDSSTMIDDLIVLKTGIVYLSLYFLFYYGVQDLESIRFLWKVVMAIAILVALEVMKEAVSYGLGSYSETQRAAGPFGDDYRGANLAAVYLAIMIPVFAAAAFFLRKQSLLRLIALGGCGLLIMAMFFTYSRQAYAITAVALLLLATRKNIVIGILVSLVLVNYEYWAPAPVLDRVNETTAETDAYGNQKFDSSTESRWELWAGASQMFAGSPQGIGLNHFKRNVHLYTQYRDLDAHNFYVLIMAEAGVMGILGILFLVVSMVIFAIKHVRKAREPDEMAMTIGLLGATISILMGNLFGSRFLNGEVVASYWIMAALVAKYFVLKRSSGAVADTVKDDKPMTNLEIRQARVADRARRRFDPKPVALRTGSASRTGRIAG